MPKLQSVILLIEEEPTLLQITAFRLELLGHAVHAVESATAANAWLADNMPHLIAVGHVSDIDPVELLNKLSDAPATSVLPLVYISANSDLTEVQRAFNAGADEYLVTPYDPSVLEKKIEGLLIAASSASNRD